MSQEIINALIKNSINNNCFIFCAFYEYKLTLIVVPLLIVILPDVLFTIVNLSRHININPEIALDKSIDKFTDRFHKLEQYMKENILVFIEQSIEKLDILWNKIKRIK